MDGAIMLHGESTINHKNTMKLYATVTSERATKGQGGNQFINIDLLVGDKKNQIDAGRICMKTTGDVFWIEYFGSHTPGQGIERIKLFQTEKGKNQKDEKRPQYLNTETGEYEYDEDR